MDQFYVYEHWRPDTGVCFYVGKGKGERAYARKRWNRYYTSIEAKLNFLKMSVIVKIVKSSLSEDDAFALEIKRIAMWRRRGVKLANATDGGEGLSGLKFSDSHRKKIRKALAGKKKSNEHRKKLREAWKKRRKLYPVSVETRAKISAAGIGNKHSLGKMHSAKTRAKMKASQRRRRRLNPVSKTTVARTKAWWSNPKNRLQRSVDTKAWWAKRRAL